MHVRRCGEATREPDIKPNECRKLLRGTGGSLDCETRWMQEVVEGHRGGSSDIETRWSQEVCGEARAGGEYIYIWAQRYWTQMTMYARSCGETRGGSLDIETAWPQEVAQRHRCGRALDIETWCLQDIVGEATGEPHMKPNECRKLLRVEIIDIETQWMQEV